LSLIFRFTGILAILAIPAAAGIRLALLLLMIDLVENQKFWSQVPLLSQLHPQGG